MDKDSPLVMKPLRGMRVLVWALTALGAILVLGATKTTQLPVAILEAAFGAFIMTSSIYQAIAKLTVTPAGLRWRTLWPVRVPASEITEITVRTVPGYAYRRIRIDVHRKTGRTLKLNPLQRPDSPRNLEKTEADAEAIRHILGLAAPAPAG